MLVTEVYPADESSNHDTLRLIPEMNFACNGTVVGLTVAGRWERESGTTSPTIQIWRQDKSSKNIYHRTNASIAIRIDESVCVDTSALFQRSVSADSAQVWQCTTSNSTLVVQAGDILGLLLPPGNDTSFQMSFARVSRGPTNYVFAEPDQQKVLCFDLSDTTGAAISLSQELPQVAIQVESGKQDLAGWPHIARIFKNQMFTNYLCDGPFSCKKFRYSN